MCEHCEGMIAINDNDFEDLLELALQNQGLNQAVTSKPTFKPNKNLGEGTASKDEIDYRTELIAVLALLYPSISKIVKNEQLSTDKKIVQITNLINTRVSDKQSVVSTYTKQIFDNAVTTANTNLKKIKSDIKKQIPSNNKLIPIQDQQNGNLNAIGNTLTARISEGLREQDVNAEIREDYEYNYDFINSSFNEAQTRFDGMGWYGYYKSNETGLIGTYAMGIVILGELVADWEDAGDESVCPDCQDLADNGPYSVLNWPEEPHFGCRCGMGAPYLPV